MVTKSWIEKRNEGKEPIVKRTEKRFADIPENSLMLIASPQLIDQYIRQVPAGTFVDASTIRKDLASEFQAEYTCPVTTGIFLRVVAEAALEELNSGASLNSITPFWRAIPPQSKLAAKLSCGTQFLEQQRTLELEK